MNRLREFAKADDRPIAWCARKIGISRQGLEWKIEHDSFTDSERQILADALGFPKDHVFPENEIARVG